MLLFFSCDDDCNCPNTERDSLTEAVGKKIYPFFSHPMCVGWAMRSLKSACSAEAVSEQCVVSCVLLACS